MSHSGNHHIEQKNGSHGFLSWIHCILKFRYIIFCI
uniref:Uncharacterized protein n=1 Tax=Anguilla anguilla TaxID=7936 RepID=A0A0E9QAB9_ANGAN